MGSGGFVCPQVCSQVVDNWSSSGAGWQAAALFGACLLAAGHVGEMY